MINVYCENRGWLFEDLKNKIASYGAIASEQPLPEADAWICIRTHEKDLSPDKSRTVVQVHGLYSEPIHDCGAISFVHQDQLDRWKGFDLNSIVLPIGSRDIPYEPELPKIPTIGFYCREVDNLKRSRMFAKAIKKASELAEFKVLMIGENLEHISHIGNYEVRDATPEDYKRITALVTTSVSTMIPISAYEAISAGRTVITTPRRWPEGHNWSMVKTGDTVDELQKHIVDTVTENKTHDPFSPYTRDRWAQEQIKLAKSLLRKKKND